MMMHRFTLFLGIACVGVLAQTAAALDTPTLYLRRLPADLVAALGLGSQYVIYPCIPARTTDRELRIYVRTQREEAFPTFFGLPERASYVLPEGNATASLIITTGPDGIMPGCAGITVQLFRQRGGLLDPLATGQITTTLRPPSAGGTTPVEIPIAITGAAETRTFAQGESLVALILVKNTCPDASGRSLTLRYDATDRLSRIEFEQVPPPEIRGPLDPDGDNVVSLCDNCPTIPNPDQQDSDGNGIGDVCEECTGDTCTCDAVSCDDGDQCTVDTCTAAVGCVSTPMVFLDAVRCRLDRIEGAILNAPPEDLAPKLARTKGPILRALRRTNHAVDKAQKAIDKNRPPRKVGRRVAKVSRLLGHLATRISELPGGISVGLRQLILDNAQQAQDAISTD
jgi:hypothetical protein